MRERQPSIAESLKDVGALLDERYRLDVLVRRGKTATIHVATHRNGSSAWLKMPVAAAYAPGIALESRIANAIGSALVVRDDGTTAGGVPYLVLDPPDAESVASVRARGRAGTRLTLARVMTAGDALCRVVASLHALGFATAGLDEQDVLLFTDGDVALLDLHALGEASASRRAADLAHVQRILEGLVQDVAEAGLPAVDEVLAASHADATSLQAAWRRASAVPIAAPSRPRSGSFADVPSAPLPGYDTPLSMSLEELPDPDGSVIGYLKSGGEPELFSPPLSDDDVMYAPLAKVSELPRLVRAASMRAPPPPIRRKLLVAGVIALPLLAGALLLVPARVPLRVTGSGSSARVAPPVAPVFEASIVATATKAPEPAAPEPPEDDLELTTILRTENAPLDRAVYLDGDVIGTTPLRVTVPCGPHTLQMVAGAPKQPVNLPCGGERTVRYDTKGHWTLR